MSQALSIATVALLGTRLIEASAGTGKTYTITSLYLRLIVERGLDVSEILVVTFTNAATAELRDRVRARIREALDLRLNRDASPDPTLVQLWQQWEKTVGEKTALHRLRHALANFDRSTISTIHGWCQRILREHAFQCGIDFEDDLSADQDELLEEIAQDYWSRELFDADLRIVRELYRTGRCAPSALIRLARLALSDPSVPVVGIESTIEPIADFLAADANLQTALLDAANLWRKDPDAIRTHYTEIYPRLNGNRFRKASFQTDVEAAIAFLTASPKPSDMGDAQTRAVQQLCQSRLSAPGSTKKGQSVPEHRIAQVLDPIAEALTEVEATRENLVVAFRQRFVDFIRTHVRSRKKSLHQISFDDLLQMVHEVLCGEQAEIVAEAIRSASKAALIDEFQDTDPAQYEIFRTIWGDDRATLFLVGDPKQAIYAFRGADIFAYLHAREDAGEARYSLTHNFRSEDRLIAAVNALFEQSSAPFLLDDIEFEGVQSGRRVDALRYANDSTAPLMFVCSDEPVEKEGALRALVGRVSGLLGGEYRLGNSPVQGGDIAILCRSNNEARQVRDVLALHQIATVLRSGESVYESDEAQEFLTVVRAMAQPRDATRVRTALATVALGVQSSELERLAAEDSEWEEWVENFATWHRIWYRSGFAAAFSAMAQAVQLRARLLQSVRGARALTNWLHLGELAHQLAKQRSCGPAALLEELDLAISGRSRGDSEAEQLRLETDENLVQVLTIHRSKGLEYPIVLCPFLWNDSTQKSKEEFHVHVDLHATRRLVLGGELGEKYEPLRRSEEFSEGLRLLYVALTRAKSYCEILWPYRPQLPRTPLGYLIYGDAAAQLSSVVERREALDALAGAKTFDAERYRAGLQALQKNAAENIGILAWKDEASLAIVPQSDNPNTLRLLQYPTTEFHGPRSVSFSSLSASAHRVAVFSEPPLLTHDYDELVAVTSTVEDLPVAEAIEQNFSEVLPGPQTGTALHALLEQLPWALEKRDAWDVLGSRILLNHGLDDSIAKHVLTSLADVLAAPIADRDGVFRLLDIAEEHRRAELEFVFRVGTWDGGVMYFPGDGARRSIVAEMIADALSCEEASPRFGNYAQRLRQRSFGEISGFMHGFIDLVFEHDGRFFVADHKSNDLGKTLADYHEDAMWESMYEHDYVLQASIYAVALHRILRLKLPDYDPEVHFGGVYYLYIRGMSCRSPRRGRGVLHLEFPGSVLQQLDACFEGAQS